MGITAIKSISNLHETELYYVKNHEHPDDTGGKGQALAVQPGETIACNMWIPWCTSNDEFSKWHHRISIVPLALNTFPVEFNIWQQGNYVRYSKNGLFQDNGNLVPGNCTVNGDRSVEITGTSLYDADIKFY
jgi:hypothetical protein